MRVLKMAALLAIIALFSSSCIYFRMDCPYVGPKELPKELANYYSNPPSAPLISSEKILEEKRKYLVKRVELRMASLPETPDSTVAKQEAIVMDYYEVKGGKKTPVIIVLPILGGNNQESKIFCSYFAKHGLSALIVHRDQKQKESANLENLESSLRTMVLDHRLVIDWIETRSELDPERIGAFGVSMGGIKAALLTAIDPRVKAAVFALAGGDLPYILMNSKEKGIIERVEKIMREQNLTRDELYELLKAKIQTDPIKFAKYIDATKVLMVEAVFDRVMPYKKERELGRAIGGPETIDILSGHYTSIAYIFYVRYESLCFFKRKLGKNIKE